MQWKPKEAKLLTELWLEDEKPARPAVFDTNLTPNLRAVG
jgi:hypothetical protein